MAIDFENPILHDPAETEFQELMANIQGNILKGHGRDHSVHIFVKFDSSDQAVLRSHLISVVDDIVTSALQQHVETVQFKNFRIPGAMFGNILLSAKGYLALGVTKEALEEAFTDPFFRAGMNKKHGNFHDPVPTSWEKGYIKGDIDAMFLLADDDKDYLMRQARLLINRLDKFCEIAVVEQGEALRNKDTGEGIEHFGYVDGRSQPIYLLGDEKKEGKTDKWNPVEPLKILLVKDGASSGEHAFGSYFVFRKLEQNVLGFKTRELELADDLGFKTPEQKERAGAMAVGRFEDGTPLVLSQTDGFVPRQENNFTYADDDDVFDAEGNRTNEGGLKCPYQAHIRKTNPRGDVVRRFNADEREAERDRRITRRGITFGRREKHPNDAQSLADFPTRGVGLLFMCFQANIEEQFAFMQQSWANEEKFVRGFRANEEITGIDPVISQHPSGSIPTPQNWRPNYGETDDDEGKDPNEFPFQGFVKMRGGEFFFAPSMSFLKTFEP